MTPLECERMTDILRDLFPAWEPNDREAQLWADKLKWAPDFGVVEWAIGEHRARCKWRQPALSDVRTLVNAEYQRRQGKTGTGTKISDEEREHDRVVMQDRARAAEWAKGKSDDELIGIARRVSAFVGYAGGMLPIGRAPGMSDEQYAENLRQPVAALVLCAGISAIRGREAA